MRRYLILLLIALSSPLASQASGPETLCRSRVLRDVLGKEVPTNVTSARSRLISAHRTEGSIIEIYEIVINYQKGGLDIVRVSATAIPNTNSEGYTCYNGSTLWLN